MFPPASMVFLSWNCIRLVLTCWFGMALTHITQRTAIGKLPTVHQWPLGNAASSLQHPKVATLAAGTHYYMCPPAGTQADPLPPTASKGAGSTQREAMPVFSRAFEAITQQYQHYIHVPSCLWLMWCDDSVFSQINLKLCRTGTDITCANGTALLTQPWAPHLSSTLLPTGGHEYRTGV